jgi:1-acyl-sn-glycerol-3-phosphate acyltransferase
MTRTSILPREPSRRVARQLHWISRAINTYHEFAYPLLHTRVTWSGDTGLANDEPALILANHTNQLDPAFMMMSTRRHVALLATESVFIEKDTGWIARYFGAIPKKKFTADPTAIRRLVGWAKAGACVGLFPEGERCWDGEPLPLVPGIERLIALLHLPVVTLRITNAYRVWPRWAPRPRRGRVHVEIAKARTFDRKTAPQTILEAVRESIAPQPELALSWRIRSDNLAQGIEIPLMLCPQCKSAGALQTRVHQVSCSTCTATWQVDDQTQLHRNGAPPLTLRQAIASVTHDIFAEKGRLPGDFKWPLVGEAIYVDLDERERRRPRVRFEVHDDHLVLHLPNGAQILELTSLVALSVDLRSRLVLRSAQSNIGLDIPVGESNYSVLLWLKILQARCHAIGHPIAS